MKPTLSIQITIRERLSQRLATTFDDMTLIPRADATELIGNVIDQTQLHGLLTRIRDLGLTLRSVTVSDTNHTTPAERR